MKSVWILLVQGCLFSAAFGAPAEPAVPERTFAGQTLEIPDELLDRGFAYHAQPREDTQLIVTSSAPLQRASFSTDRIVGYLIVPFDEEDSNPVADAAFRVPVASLRSGTTRLDELLYSPAFLDRAGHSEITFRLTKTDEVRLIDEGPNERIYTLLLKGNLGVKGNSFPIEIPARLTLLQFSSRTLARNVGDIAVLEASIGFRPQELGWSPPSPQFRERIAEEIRVDLYLMLNTVSPDRSGDPRDDPEIFARQARYRTLLHDLQDAAEAHAFGRILIEEIWEDAKELRRFAQTGMENGWAVRTDFPLALRAALRAVELTGASEPDALAGLARIYYRMGDLPAAVEWQGKAAEAADEETRQGQSIRETLRRYRTEAGEN
jgi:tetratricopeptide (TPR) repeat protein